MADEVSLPEDDKIAEAEIPDWLSSVDVEELTPEPEEPAPAAIVMEEPVRPPPRDIPALEVNDNVVPDWLEALEKRGALPTSMTVSAAEKEALTERESLSGKEAASPRRAEELEVGDEMPGWFQSLETEAPTQLPATQEEAVGDMDIDLFGLDEGVPSTPDLSFTPDAEEATIDWMSELGGEEVALEPAAEESQDWLGPTWLPWKRSSSSSPAFATGDTK